MTSSRRSIATGIELSIQKKACKMILDKIIFTDAFLDPITLNEIVD